MILAVIFAALGLAVLRAAVRRGRSIDRARLYRTGATRVPGSYDRALLGRLPMPDPFDARRWRRREQTRR